MPRVLIADDERPLQIALARILKTMGLETETAASGTEAAARLDHCDMLLTDVRMPGMDGMELLAEARRRRPELPVVLLTGHGNVQLAVEAMRAGAANFLTKPFDLEELEQVVRATLNLPPPKRKEPARGSAPASGSKAEKPPEPISSASSATLLGGSEAMRALRELVERVASSDANVLITGESGCGKEVVARTIHAHSRRREAPFIALDCAAIAESLIESELFGHRKGAFPGATADRAGVFVAAAGGTVLLDGIAELPAALQLKLLRVIVDKQVTPLGDDVARPVDVRVLAAAPRDLEPLVAKGTLREDLYYRLNVLHVEVPALRDRGDDTLVLARAFLARAAAQEGKGELGFDDDVARCLLAYGWPGNVRELEHAMTRATVMASGRVLSLADLPPRVRGAFATALLGVPSRRAVEPVLAVGSSPIAAPATGDLRILPEGGIDLKAMLDALERDLIRQALERTGGNKNRAAGLLGLNRTTLVEKLRRLDR